MINGTDMTVAKRILVIDDDQTVREYIQLLLEDEGFHVSVAENGSAGLEIFNRESIDLIITDLIMPEKEGLETIQDVRKPDPSCKIIAMSGASNRESYLSISSILGARAVLHKPFKPNELLNLVTGILHVKTDDTPDS
jgi:DNA-binding response OmpR family regulator